MGVAEALGSLIPDETPKRASVQPFKRPDASTPRRLDAQAAESPLQGTAKSKHPDYAKKTLYVRKSTMRDAFHRYQVDGGTEESELVERLLVDFIAGGFRG